MGKNIFLSKLSFAVFLLMALTLYTGTIGQSLKNFSIDLSYLNLPAAYQNVKTAAVGAITPNTPAAKVVIPKDDLQCMAENIYYEAGNQSFVGKLAVGQVVLNRVKQPGYPSSICGVIYEGSQNTKTTVCQFSWLCSDRRPVDKSSSMWAQSLKASSELLHNKGAIVDITDGATNYHADYVNPPWASKLRFVTQIDQHKFYALR